MTRMMVLMVLALTAACSTRQPLRAGPRSSWTLPPPRTSPRVMRIDDRPTLDAAAGLCPLDVNGVVTDLRTTHDRVLLLVQAPPGATREELAERARIMTYATHWMLPAAHDERIGRLPIAVEVSLQNANGAVLMAFKPYEPWRLRELAQVIDNERRWLGRDACR